MIELGQLDRNQELFAKRHTRIIAVSLDGLEDAAKTQAQFAHLLVLADQRRGLSEAAGMINPQSAPDGGDAAAPTTILVDRTGQVRWLYRSGEVIGRLSPDEVVQAIDRHLATGP
jgi:alkyl hydroperoxide reductase subunit AhpC